MNKTIAVICALLAALSSAHAQNPTISNPTSVVPNFDVQSVGPVLNELGVTWQAQKADNGQTYIAANVGGAVNFLLAPMACRGSGGSDCVGLQMVAIFDGDPNPQTVRAFNFRYPFASAGIDPSGVAFLSRYEISDYGLPRGNLATSIQVFAHQIGRFGSELETARRTVSLEGFADDLAASALNRQARETMSGAKIHIANPIEQHQQGLEDGAENVRRFILDTSAPRNKIENIVAE